MKAKPKPRQPRVKRGCFQFGFKIQSLVRVLRLRLEDVQEHTGIKMSKLSMWRREDLQGRPNVYADELFITATYFAAKLAKPLNEVVMYLIDDTQPPDLESVTPQELWEQLQDSLRNPPEAVRAIATQSRQTPSNNNAPHKRVTNRIK